ncbi:MAG: beta-galactosidase [Planctomycetota bacterium]
MRLVHPLMALCIAALPALSAENLLTNGDFENEKTGWHFWQKVPGTATGEPSTDCAHTGRFAFKVVNQGRGGGNLFSNDIPCEPNTPYTITVWAKTTGAKGTAIGIWGLDVNGKPIEHLIGRSTPIPDDLPRFLRFSREVTTPENCAKIRAHLVSNGGTVYWDSVEVRKGPLCIDTVLPEPKPPEGSRNMVPNSGFEEERLGWSFWQKFPGDAQDAFDTEAKHDGERSYRIVNHGAGGANVFSDDIPCKPNATYTLSAFVKTKKANRCALAGWTLDKGGKTIEYGTGGQISVPDTLDDFTRFAHTFTTPANCRFIRAHLIQNGGTVWWDDVQIEEGDKATPYRPGISIIPVLTVGREKAVAYTTAVIRHAQISDLCEQAKRAIAYAKSAQQKVDTQGERINGVRAALAKVEDILHADRIAPDFLNLDYAKANELLDRAEADAKSALQELVAALGEEKVLPPPPARPEGVVPAEKLTSRLFVFPLLSMGKCHTAFFNGSYDWAMLAPFGFEAISPGVYGRNVKGQYDFAEAKERIAATAKLGLLADIQVSEVHEIRRQLFDKYGEEIYLHAADGQWSEQGDCHQVINIWHPEVRRVNNEYLEAIGRALRDDPTILCYELINEPSLHISKWAERFRSEPIGPGGYSKAARAAWPKYLAEKHETIGKLNERWGTTYESFEKIEPPATIDAEPPTNFPAPEVPLAIEFNRFRAESHNEYFRDSIAALRRGDPNHAILPQFIAGVGPRVECADDLLGLSLAGWDLFSTHDWPGDNPAVTCLYAYSINRYVKLPMWEDEFIFSHWMQKGVDPRLVRPGIERNLWRMVAWGKRGIHLFNLENEWRAGFPDNWNNSILNIEAGSKIVRFETGAIKVFKDRAERVAPLLFDTEIERQGIGILQPTSTLYSGIVRRRSSRISSQVCAGLLRRHWMPFFIPEECIIDGRENLSEFKLLIAPYAACVPGALEEKLIAWIREGGVLVTIGPFGAYDDMGREGGRLLSQVSKQVPAEKLRDDCECSSLGAGKAWLMGRDTDKWNDSDAATFDRVLSKTFSLQPITCGSDEVEIILRCDAKGDRYLCATHLDYGAPVQTEIKVAGEFRNTIDVTIAEGVKVPVNVADGRTTIPLRLGPGGAAVLRLSK